MNPAKSWIRFDVLAVAVTLFHATPYVHAGPPARFKLTQFAGFIYYQTPSRVFPVRVVNGKTNILAAKWQWRDMHPVSSDRESTPRMTSGIKQPLTKDPLPAWELLDGMVKEIGGNWVSMEVERDIKKTRIVNNNAGPANSFNSIGGGGPVRDIPPSRVTVTVGTTTQRVRVFNVPPSIVPEVGVQFRAWARPMSEAKYDFGVIPKIETREN